MGFHLPKRITCETELTHRAYLGGYFAADILVKYAIIIIIIFVFLTNLLFPRSRYRRCLEHLKITMNTFIRLDPTIKLTFAYAALSRSMSYFTFS